MTGLLAAFDAVKGFGKSRDGGPLLSRVQSWRILGILVLIAIEAMLYGYSYPYFSLALEKRDLANWLIGLNASLAGAGILVVGPFLPRLIRMFGLRQLVACLFSLSLLSFAALLAVDSVPVWFLARFVMGACFAALWATTEIWLNGVVDDRHRGRIIGVSGSLYAGAQFLGPLALSATGVTGVVPIIAAMLPLGLGIVVAVAIGSSGRQAEPAPAADGDLRLAVRLVGPLIAAAFFAGIAEVSLQSLLPLYGLANGLGDADAVRLVALLSLGEGILVAVLGFLADRVGRAQTLRLAGVAALAITVLMPLSVTVPSLLGPTLFLAGGTISGIYTLGVVQIGQDFRGHQLAVVSTGFAMGYAAGAVVGSTPTGLAIDLLGHDALPYAMAISFVALAVLVFLKAAQYRPGVSLARGQPTSLLTR